MGLLVATGCWPDDDHSAHDGLVQFAKIIVEAFFVQGHFKLLFYVSGVELLIGIRSLSARYRVQKFFRIDPADGIAFLDFYNRGNKSRLDDFYSPIGESAVPGKLPIEVAVSVSAQLIQRLHNPQTNSTSSRQTQQEYHDA